MSVLFKCCESMKMLSPHRNKHSPYSDIVPLESRQDRTDAKTHRWCPRELNSWSRLGFLISWIEVQTWKWATYVTSKGSRSTQGQKNDTKDKWHERFDLLSLVICSQEVLTLSQFKTSTFWIKTGKKKKKRSKSTFEKPEPESVWHFCPVLYTT